MGDHGHTNELIHETSPYLLQHAHNPVDWLPWGEKAKQRAKQEDKPILLSIGYSACHWCHVMERESFEDEAIARLMNDNFVNVKVDREERPDLDSIYMRIVQMLTGSGGWPMTLFLTPDMVPFYGGTYYPPQDRHGLPGFPRVLLSVARAYKERKEVIGRDAAQIKAHVEQSDLSSGPKGELNRALLTEATSRITSESDPQNGGFGQAPKFPPAMALEFLMRAYRTGASDLLEFVEHTLAKMAHGGIYDQLGGGFHRYSVDAHWLVPHFEKMLYDNALLSRTYLDAYLLTGKTLYRRITEETLDYVVREMTSPEGGFYSTQDADSEGEEGKFFLWTRNEVGQALGEAEAELACSYYDISPEGNFEGKNILNVPRPADVLARIRGIPQQELESGISGSRKVLFEIREKRPKPARDEKIITAWNGLMLRSFAEAAAALNREDYRQAAVRNGQFILERLQEGGRLLRSYRQGRAKLNGYLEDYALLIDGLISLYEATFEESWLREAERLSETMTTQFWDSASGGFYFTSEDHESLIHRPKEFTDNAMPSGNSAAVSGLLRLWKHTGDDRWAQYAVTTMEVLAPAVQRYASAFPHLLSALDFWISSAKEIAVVGNPQTADTRLLLDAIFHRFLPNKVVQCGIGSSLFLLRDRPQPAGRPAVYVCQNFTCQAPVTTPEELDGLTNDD